MRRIPFVLCLALIVTFQIGLGVVALQHLVPSGRFSGVESGDAAESGKRDKSWFSAANVVAKGAEWIRAFGGLDLDIGSAVVECGDGGFGVLGTTMSHGAGACDVWLIRTDINGYQVWARTYGGLANDYGASLVRCADGGFAIAGSTASFGAGGFDTWLIRTDAYGIVLWNYTFGTSAEDYGYALADLGDEGFAMTGDWGDYLFLLRTDADGRRLWNQTYGVVGGYGHAIVECHDNGFAIAGEALNVFSNQTMWLVRTNSTGHLQWSRYYGGAGWEWCSSVSECSNGGFVLAGATNSFSAGSFDARLVRTNGTGEVLWQRNFGGVDDDRAQAVVACAEGGFAFTGFTTGGSGVRAWLVRTDSYGTPMWNQTYTGDSDSEGSSLIISSDGSFVIAGSIYGLHGPPQDVLLIHTSGSVPPLSPPPIPGFPWEGIVPAVIATLVLVMIRRHRLRGTLD